MIELVALPPSVETLSVTAPAVGIVPKSAVSHTNAMRLKAMVIGNILMQV